MRGWRPSRWHPRPSRASRFAPAEPGRKPETRPSKPRSKAARPVLMYLHGRGGNPAEDCRKWARVGRQFGWVVCPSGPGDAGGGEVHVAHQALGAFARDGLDAEPGGFREADFPDSSPLAGIAFQEALENRAFLAGGEGYRAPAQNLLAFLGRKGASGCRSTYRPGVVEAELAAVLPDFVTATLREGLITFDRQMRGFVTAEATLVGVESRTSAPVRILRGSDCQSLSHRWRPGTPR